MEHREVHKNRSGKRRGISYDPAAVLLLPTRVCFSIHVTHAFAAEGQGREKKRRFIYPAVPEFSRLSYGGVWESGDGERHT